ncbi:MAG TPA: hypothetical protein DDZ80_21870 [Cyanobacteria bacterium UBA8803]|nr:hypothetical protein [Cyanobacteria bacterium UBA9273]HBL60979.1 hypothetical protein [Cyanobacteria bacterium UBA8803]
MYESAQKKTSSWTPASIQKKSKSFSKPGSSAVQPKLDTWSNSQAIPSYSTAPLDLLTANIMPSVETQEAEPLENATVQRQAEPGGVALTLVAPPIVSTPSMPTVQSKEVGVQRQCAACASEQQEHSAEEGKEIDEMSVAASGIQTKLTVGAPGDPYEQEADRVAAQVMSMSDSSPQVQRFEQEENPVQMWSLVQSITPLVQRQEDESVQMRSQLQRAFEPGGNEASLDLESRLNASKGRGSSLAPSVRAFMEPRFGADFSAVRVHTGAEAVQMNRELGAQAFTHGSDVYFGALKSPGNNELTAHELTHVVQQTGKNQSATIRTSPDTEQLNGGDTGNERQALLKNAADVIESEGGKAKFSYLAADPEWNSSFIMFDDFPVHKLYRHLFEQWFGSTDVESLENTTDLSVPPGWVAEFRAKALNVQPKKPGDNDYDSYLEQKQLADLAIKLADSVAAETPAQKIRRQFVQEADKRVGTTVMSQDKIDEERKKPASGGLTPQNFTTCIAFFSQVVGQVTNKSGINSPLLKGPNAYKEINPAAKENLPPGAWHGCSPGTKSRPKPGDLLIFTFAEDVKNDAGQLKYGKGWFAHISIFRAIQPVQKPISDQETYGMLKECGGENGNLEKWISIDGGGTTASEAVRYFCPDNCLIKGRTDKRTLHGWIDIEKAAEAQLVKEPGQ